MTITCILFDLGNVLLLHNAQRRLAALEEACGKSPDEIVQFFARTGLIDQLDTGKADETDLSHALSEFSGRSISTPQAIQLWSSVFEPNQLLWNDLQHLKGKYTLGAFSNNPPFIQHLFPAGFTFDHMFLSARLGVMKPNTSAFHAVQSELGIPPGQIIFVDDKKENIDQALLLGWNGVVFESNEQLHHAFTHFEIW